MAGAAVVTRRWHEWMVLLAAGVVVAGGGEVVLGLFLPTLPAALFAFALGITAMLVTAALLDRWRYDRGRLAAALCRPLTGRGMVMAFGGRGHVCNGAAVLPENPTYAACQRCREPVTDEDVGFVRPTLGTADPEFLVGVGGEVGPGGQSYVLTAIHQECALAEVCGHAVGVCGCTGWAPFSRETSREVQRRVRAGALEVDG